MRKSKKILAVLLVLAISFALVPVAGADNRVKTIASFEDAGEVSQDRSIQIALDVLAATGVLVGENDRIFPQRNVTRAEAAAVVARVLLGPNAAAKLCSGSKTGFRDVDGISGVNFAAGAIAYLVGRGIVVGAGDGRFFPNRNVTGTEIAVMFLRAVGFGVNGEYEGPHWERNAIVDGMRWRILQGGADFMAPATREEMFFYAYNAMNTRSSDVGLRFVSWSADRQAYVPVMLQGALPDVGGDRLGLETIYLRVFRQSPINLRYSFARDIFGRPADVYAIGGAEIVLSTWPEAHAHTTGAPIGEILNSFNIGPQGADGEIPIFVQGTLEYTPEIWQSGTPGYGSYANLSFTDADAYGISAAQLNFIHANTLNRAANRCGEEISGLSRTELNSRVQAHAGQGVLIEVFVDEATNNIHTIAVVRTDIAQIVRKSDFSVTIMPKFADGAHTGIAPAAIDAFGTIDVRRTSTFGSVTSLLVVPANPHFEALSELHIGDSVLVSFVRDSGYWVLGDMAVPETVTGAFTGSIPMSHFSTGYLTVGGATYSRALIMTPIAARMRLAAENRRVTLVLDIFNNVVDIDASEAEISTRDIIIVTGNRLGETPYGPVLVVTGFYPDGVAAAFYATDSLIFPGLAGAGAGRDWIRDQGATAGAIIRTGRLGPGTWEYVATPELEENMFGVPGEAPPSPFAPGPRVRAETGTIPPLGGLIGNTSTPNTPRVVALGMGGGQEVINIPANAWGVTVGGQFAAFTPYARYHFFTPAAARESGLDVSAEPGGVVVTRDRSEALNDFSSNGWADVNQILAVVEYKGFGLPPVISALWIGLAAAVAGDARDDLVFVRSVEEGSAPFFLEGVGEMVYLHEARDINGELFAMPFHWPFGNGQIVPVPDSFTGEGFYRVVSIDAHGRLNLVRLGDGGEIDGISVLSGLVGPDGNARGARVGGFNYFGGIYFIDLDVEQILPHLHWIHAETVSLVPGTTVITNLTNMPANNQEQLFAMIMAGHEVRVSVAYVMGANIARILLVTHAGAPLTE